MDKSGRKTISVEELFRLEQENASPITTNGKKEQDNQENLLKAKKENKFYLPVLHINDPAMWPSKEKSQRRHFTETVAKQTCLSNCCNVPGLWSACCRVDPEDMEHVLGPVDEDWIKKIVKFFKKRGQACKRNDIVIDFEEGLLIGEKFFNGHSVFKKRDSYPMMRMQVVGLQFGCKFLNVNDGSCNIYENRPDMCKKYYCQYVKKFFLLKTTNQPNTWKKIE